MTAFDRAWLILKMEPPEYQGSHGAPLDPEYHSPLHDMVGMFPEDLYSHMGAQYYGHGSDDMRETDRHSHRLIMDVRGNPEADVMVYRTVPWEIETARINPGDWVSISRKYAINHGRSFGHGNYGKGGFRLLKKRVKAKDLFSEGDIHEYGWRGHT